jgi:hypothetical protein
MYASCAHLRLPATRASNDGSNYHSCFDEGCGSGIPLRLAVGVMPAAGAAERFRFLTATIDSHGRELRRSEAVTHGLDALRMHPLTLLVNSGGQPAAKYQIGG